MEIGENIYMKFRHAYVVGEVKEEEITLLDPHGDVEGKDKRKVYSPDLADLVQEFYAQLVILEDELAASDYNGFSVDIKNKMERSIISLKQIDGEFEDKEGVIIEELRKNWVRLSNKNKLVETDGQLTGLRSKTAKNILEVLKENKEMLTKKNIGKGFRILKRKKKVLGKQQLDYKLLKHFFESVRINKIK